MYARLDRWMLPHLWLIAALALESCSVAFGAAESVPAIPNANFDQGNTSPIGWTLSGGKGRWVDRKILEVTGNGNDDNQWRCDCRFTSGELYRFQMRARNIGGGDSATSGPSFANHDQPLSDQWAWYGYIFRAPDNVGNDYLRLGQWHQNGSIQFDAVRLAVVMPIHKIVGSLPLGDGESIQGGRYTFNGWFGHEGGNFHRTLVSATAGFNTDRWCFGGKNEVTYRFALPGYPFRSGRVAFDISYHVRGGCIAEISRDQKVWRSIATRDSLGHVAADLPADMLPAEVFYLRLRPSTEDSVFQINQIDFSAELSGTPPQGVGRTEFAEVANASPDLAIERLVLDESEGPGRPIFRMTAKNRGSTTVQAVFSAQAAWQQPGGTPSGKPPANPPGQSAVRLAPNQTHTFESVVPLNRCGLHEIRLSLCAADGKAVLATLPWTLSEHYRTDFGRRIDGVAGNAEVWWCEAAWKIAQKRAAPQEGSPAATLSAARNDREAVQIVVRPNKDLKQFTAAAGAMSGPEGVIIPAENVQVLRVYYHHVKTPTDNLGVSDWWPDALPPLDKPLDLPAGKNQPLWVLIHVPKGAAAGDYSGAITLMAEGWSAVVPVKLHVWNFALPEKNHLETTFGLSMHRPFQYQQLKTDADKRRVVDMYLQNFADHRISPYNPTPLDPIRVKFVPEANPPRAELDFSAFDAAMTRAIEKFHFTNFMLPLEGMGGGTFEGRSEGKIGEFGEHTPQYRAMFSSYVKQLESHLREKGWLKMAYTYWFDEPEPKDYAFVQAGMDRLKKYAPGLQTMITKHELQEGWPGKIDIWCPISFNYNHNVAEKRRPHGDRYWWYVCCGPKAPFCTLFIDHPATDLRVWLWQTWQRNIVGILVWESVWWTSRDEPVQNPYEDPMGYVSGSRPDEKKYWGNGDGRFLYPPLAAAVPGASGSGPVIAPPVSSIRWEMLREGIEDYECLWLLRDLITKKRPSLAPEQLKAYESLLEVPEAITRDMISFTTDPAPIYARRKAIAEAIEKLSK